MAFGKKKNIPSGETGSPFTGTGAYKTNKKHHQCFVSLVAPKPRAILLLKLRGTNKNRSFCCPHRRTFYFTNFFFFFYRYCTNVFVAHN